MSGNTQGHPAEIAPQFAALNLNGPNGARPRPPEFSTFVDVGSNQTRGPMINKKNPIYSGVSLIRHKRPGVDLTWRYAERRPLHFSSEELAERTKKRKLAASKVYGTLPPNMRNQVDRLVEDENRQDPDKAFEWVLVTIDTKPAHLGRIDVILRRDPNPRAAIRAGNSSSGMAGHPNVGGYPGATQERGPINPDPRSQGPRGGPPMPPSMMPPPQQQQPQKQGAPPQKQPPIDSYGGGPLGNGNQQPPPPPPPPGMQAMPGPPPPPPPPQPQQKVGQNMPFNAFNQGPSMQHQGIPQQRNQQQRPQPPLQGGQNMPPNLPPLQKPIVEQYGQQNHSRAFPHQSHHRVDSFHRRREDPVLPWLEGDGVEIYEDDHSTDESEYTLSSSQTEYTREGSSPSRSNSMKMGKHPERGFDGRADITFLAKTGSRSPRTSSYRHHRRESTDLDHHSLDEPRDRQHNHRRSGRHSYDGENTRRTPSRGRDSMAVSPRTRYTEDEVEFVGFRDRSRPARESSTRGTRFRHPSNDYSDYYPRRRHMMHDHHRGYDDSYGVSPPPLRPAVVYGSREISPRRSDRRTPEYAPYPSYSGHGFYDPRRR